MKEALINLIFFSIDRTFFRVIYRWGRNDSGCGGLPTEMRIPRITLVLGNVTFPILTGIGHGRAEFAVACDTTL